MVRGVKGLCFLKYSLFTKLKHISEMSLAESIKDVMGMFPSHKLNWAIGYTWTGSIFVFWLEFETKQLFLSILSLPPSVKGEIDGLVSYSHLVWLAIGVFEG